MVRQLLLVVAFSLVAFGLQDAVCARAIAAYPLILLVAGAAGAALLLAPRTAAAAPGAAAPESGPPDERQPFHVVEPAIGTALALAAVSAAAAGGLMLARWQHAAGNPLLALLGSGLALGAGWRSTRRTGAGATLCLGGIQPAGEGAAFVPWRELASLARERGAGYTLTLRGPRTGPIRLELGDGPEAARTASSVGAFLRPWLLTRARDLLAAGKPLDLEQLQLSSEAVGWELTNGFRMHEFDDLQAVRLHDGRMTFRLVSSESDDLAVRYQELPNGFLLPALLVTQKRSVRSTCAIGWKQPGISGDALLDPPLALEGEDAWVAQVEPATRAALIQHGRFWLERAEERESVALVARALAFFEAAGRPEARCVWEASLAFGHYMLEAKQPGPARDAFERARQMLSRAHDHADVEDARALHGLALARWKAKDAPGAMLSARSAVDALGEGAGVPLVHLVMIVNTLAGLQHAEGQGVAALELMDWLLARLEEAAPGELPEHEEELVLSVVRNYSKLAEEMHDAKLLVDVHARGVAACRRLFGAGSLIAGQGLFSLGSSLLDNHDAAAAVSVLEECVAIFEQSLGERHPWVAGGLDRLGQAYWHVGRREHAEAAWQLAAQIVQGPEEVAA